MRIYDTNLTNASAAETSRAQEAERAGRSSGGASKGASSGKGDHVELSGKLSSLASAMNSYSADRSAKVQALAAQYKSGAYQPDSAATSRGMVAEAVASGVQ